MISDGIYNVCRDSSSTGGDNVVATVTNPNCDFTNFQAIAQMSSFSFKHYKSM